MPYRGILVESTDRIWLNTIQVLFLSNFAIQIISITAELKRLDFNKVPSRFVFM